MKKISVLFSCMVLFFLFGCKPDEPIVPDDPVPAVTIGGMLVLNEGAFNYATSTLTYYNPEKDSVANYVFFNANGVPIGDVGQSLALIEDKLYIVVNNSNYIYKVNANTFVCDTAKPYQISGFASPRYMLPIAPDKAYVSDIISTNLWIINPQTMTHTGKISMGKSTENMLRVGNEVYVTNWSKYYVEGMENNTVQVVDINNDTRIANITVSTEPNCLVLDKNGYVWVMCEGESMDPSVPSELWKIDPATKNATMIRSFDQKALNLAIDPTGTYLYFIYGGTWTEGGDIKRVSVDDPTADDSFSISGAGKLFYKVFVNPDNGDIYVSDAKNYQMEGTVYRYSSEGTLLKSFDAGLIPGYMLFY